MKRIAFLLTLLLALPFVTVAAFADAATPSPEPVQAEERAFSLADIPFDCTEEQFYTLLTEKGDATRETGTYGRKGANMTLYGRPCTLLPSFGFEEDEADTLSLLEIYTALEVPAEDAYTELERVYNALVAEFGEPKSIGIYEAPADAGKITIGEVDFSVIKPLALSGEYLRFGYSPGAKIFVHTAVDPKASKAGDVFTVMMMYYGDPAHPDFRLDALGK